MINELLLIVMSMIVLMYILPKRMECQYRIDKDGRTVFYPFSYKQGYILDDPSLIKQAANKNLVWKHNAIKTLLVGCETTDIPLDNEIFKQNIARNSGWAELWIMFIISAFIAVHFFFSKLYVLAVLCCLLAYPHINLLCLKRKLQNK